MNLNYNYIDSPCRIIEFDNKFQILNNHFNFDLTTTSILPSENDPRIRPNGKAYTNKFIANLQFKVKVTCKCYNILHKLRSRYAQIFQSCRNEHPFPHM